MNLTDIKLPPKTHATILTGRDVVTGEDLQVVIVWTDRATGTCPLCGQPIPREIEDSPAMLDTGACQGGAVLDWDKQHGCGQWLSVNWTQVEPGEETTDDIVPGVTENAILTAAERLAVELSTEIAEQHAAIEYQLCRDLEAAVARLAEPLDDDETEADRAEEVTTGSDIGPGVYCGDGGWQAWAFDPAGDEGDCITVYATDLPATTNA